MTAKEKAQELLDKFRNEFIWVEADYPVDLYRDTKQCAIICVDEILDVLGSSGVYSFADPKVTENWEQVKKEIEQVK